MTTREKASTPGLAGTTSARGHMASVRTRIVAWVGVLTAAGLLATGLIAYLGERARIETRINDSLQQELREFAELQRTGVDPDTGQPFATSERLLRVAMQRNVPDEHQTFVAFLAQGAIVPASGSLPLHRDADFRRLATAVEIPTYGDFTSPAGGSVRFAAMPVLARGARATFVVAYFSDPEFGELRGAIGTYAVTGSIVFLGVCLVAWLTAGRLLRPIRELQATAQSITESDLSRRIEVTGNDDVTELARTFNAMLDRLAGAFSDQRDFLDDVGHELRTPITIVQGHIELLDANRPQEAVAAQAIVLDELDRMSRLVDDLVVLAKARRPDFVRPAPLDIAMMTRQIHEKVTALSQRTWVLDDTADVIIRADKQRLTQAMLQLADNASAVTMPGDVIGLGSQVAGRTVRLWVRDTGPGVPVEDRQRIFERLDRGGGQRLRSAGAGLGLSIVAAIAEAHGGTAFVDSVKGRGARFVIEIPRADIGLTKLPADHRQDQTMKTGALR